MPLPQELRTLLAFCSGIESLLDGIDFTGASLSSGFAYEEIFPADVDAFESAPLYRPKLDLGTPRNREYQVVVSSLTEGPLQELAKRLGLPADAVAEMVITSDEVLA